MASGLSSGIRRKVDDLGRVVIPAGIRRTLNIREGDTVEVSVDGERVVLAKPRDACVFCGREDDDLDRYRTRLICRECLVALRDVGARHDGATTPAPDTAPTTGTSGASARQVGPGDRAAAQPPATDAPPAAPDRPSSWPPGPIDGDALARQLARERAGPADAPSADARPGDAGSSDPR